MILAEKITKLRKQNGWSQEELAMKLNISRQSVSKWESTASIPDLDKIIKLSQIFGVSTDYLLKDEIEEENGRTDTFAEEADVESEMLRSVSLDEANTYMNLVERVSKRIAAGVATCILSPVLLILLGGMADSGIAGVTENVGGGLGMCILLLMVAGAVAVFITQGMQLEKYKYMEESCLSLQYGVAGIVEAKKESFEPFQKNCIVVGVTLCIVSTIPLIVTAIFGVSEFAVICCTDLILVLVALAVFLFVWSGMICGSYQRLLEEGEYTREKKIESKKNDNLARVYWCTVVAIYLGYSLVTNKWDVSWVVWPCAGVLYAAVCGLAAIIRR